MKMEEEKEKKKDIKEQMAGEVELKELGIMMGGASLQPVRLEPEEYWDRKAERMARYVRLQGRNAP